MPHPYTLQLRGSWEGETQPSPSVPCPRASTEPRHWSLVPLGLHPPGLHLGQHSEPTGYSSSLHGAMARAQGRDPRSNRYRACRTRDPRWKGGAARAALGASGSPPRNGAVAAPGEPQGGRGTVRGVTGLAAETGGFGPDGEGASLGDSGSRADCRAAQEASCAITISQSRSPAAGSGSRPLCTGKVLSNQVSARLGWRAEGLGWAP